jgi:hypothetical protein
MSFRCEQFSIPAASIRHLLKDSAGSMADFFLK